MRIKWGNLLAFLLVAAGLVGYFQWEKITTFVEKEQEQAKTTSLPVSKESVVYARDTWITGGVPELGLARGYHRDYRLELTQAFFGSDDERLEALGEGKVQFTEISFPSLLFNLERVGNGKYKDQVVVLAFIDYSRGGDGLIVQSGVKTVNDLINRRVGFVGDGTGKYLLSFLLRMVDLRLEDVKAQPYKDEAEMAADFAAGKLDAIAYWQPGMSDVLRTVKGSRVLLSTADMPTLIPDVLVANRKYVAENPAKAEAFLKFWFATIKHISERPDMAYERWAEALNRATYTEGGQQEPIYGTENSPDVLKDIFTKEVRLVGLEENLKLMGLTQAPELDQMVRFALDNWSRVEDIKGPNAASLFSNRVLDAVRADVTLKVAAIDPSKSGNAPLVVEKPKEFSKSADPGKLDEVAQMAIPNIEFDPDATTITTAGKKIIETILLPLLRQFPNFYLLVDGHTDVGGDERVLMALAQGRADSVKKELLARGFPEAQIIARGFGDKKPLFPTPRNDVEKAKNRRTEFRLLRDPAGR